MIKKINLLILPQFPLAPLSPPRPLSAPTSQSTPLPVCVQERLSAPLLFCFPLAAIDNDLKILNGKFHEEQIHKI